MQESVWLAYLLFDVAVASIIIVAYLGCKLIAFLLTKHARSQLNSARYY